MADLLIRNLRSRDRTVGNLRGSYGAVRELHRRNGTIVQLMHVIGARGVGTRAGISSAPDYRLGISIRQGGRSSATGRNGELFPRPGVVTPEALDDTGTIDLNVGIPVNPSTRVRLSGRNGGPAAGTCQLDGLFNVIRVLVGDKSSRCDGLEEQPSKIGRLDDLEPRLLLSVELAQ